MTEPLVCAVMLTKDRPVMAARAVRSFREQTYPNKKLLIVNGNTERIIESDIDGILEPDFVELDGMTVGALRNLGCRYASAHYAASNDRPEIFCHFDDDDISHPRRIEEQVALLQSSGADAVGYNDMVFWDNHTCKHDNNYPCEEATAWHFQNLSPRYALGTSLCYWRRTWEKNPFPDKQRGEDWDFVYGCVTVGVTSMFRESGPSGSGTEDLQPRMIASIHAGNARDYEIRFQDKARHQWRREPAFDQYCRDRMAL